MAFDARYNGELPEPNTMGPGALQHRASVEAKIKRNAPPLEEINERVSISGERVAKVIAAINSVSDQILGAPEEKEPVRNNSFPSGPGQLGAVFYALNQNDQLLEELEASAQRLLRGILG